MSPHARAKAMAAIEASLLEKDRRTAAQRKMSSELLDRVLEDPRGEVEVDIRADVTPELLVRIGELGGELVSAFPGYRAIRAVLPASALEELAESDDVQTLAVAERGVSNRRAPASGHGGGNEAGELPGPPEAPRSRSLASASVRLKDNTSEGDIAHQADLARQTHRVDGTGIGIGVISDGVRTLASRQATGDLPAHVTILPGRAGAGDEGAAMLEIVHDLAPGADLYFAAGTNSKAQMAANIGALCAAGADIIVDDLQFADDPAFQDGLISGAISSVVGQGCLYFVAAGNGGNLNDGTSGVWEGDYVQGDPLTVGGETVGRMHDFGGGVHENRVEKDTRRWFTLQWSDPWGAAANDYDLFLVDAAARGAPQTVASGLTATGYTDSGVSGTTYAYQAQAQADGGTVTRSARVTVISGAANRPPAAVGTLPDLNLRAGADAVTVDVEDDFVDPDGDTLTFAAASDGTAVTATVSGSVTTLTPVSVGSALITVSATDADGSNTSARQRFRVTVWSASAVDYDSDDDRLIEIDSHQQLDAVRYDLDGDGFPEATDAASYASAFPDAIGLMGCPNIDGCSGYELTVDLDLDTNGNGTADVGDAYWNGGLGWNPIGGEGSSASGGITYLRNPLDTVFEGNGHRVSNLYVRSETNPLLAGLFGYAGRGSLIRNLAVVDADVAGLRHVGTLVGTTDGSVTGVYATGRVEGTGAQAFAGGLAGQKLSNSLVSVSYASVSVEGTANAVGGLVGLNFGEIEASYATGAVAGTIVGALVGRNAGTIVASYATGALPGIETGYLVRERFLSGTASDSYFDTQTAGVAFQDSTGQTTSSLQSPTDYSGIYSTWNVDIDGDGSANDPWDFGGSGDYPALNHDFDGSGTATWEEFGYQLRDGPTLTIATGSGQPVLTWTAVATDDWDPEPSVLYTVTREDGTDVNTLASGLAVLTYTDGDVIEGETYSYQVTAGTGAGEAVRSAVVEVTTPVDPTTPPRIRSIASDATHPTKDAFTVTIGFTKAVTGLEASEIEVDNGSASNFSGSGATYRLRVTPDAEFEGDVTVRVPAGVAVDGASNLNEVGSETFAAATTVSVEVGASGDTATEGSDYATVGTLTLTIPAYARSATVRFMLTP
ncbi:MAG: Ig-like domain-containing protein, partial [Gammaproteobacteria bacterium]|nr:Ig-like domain-containing protein [Gammaproteobacteria bacterium]